LLRTLAIAFEYEANKTLSESNDYLKLNETKKNYLNKNEPILLGSNWLSLKKNTGE